MSHHDCHECAQCACHNPLWSSFENQPSLDKIKTSINQAYANKQETDQEALKKLVMYSGGTIRPMINGSTEQVDAVGFAGDTVVAVGDLDSVSTKMHALGMLDKDHIELAPQQTLLPGLIEPHVHIVPTAMTMSWAPLGPYNDKPYDSQRLKEDYSPETIFEAALEAEKHLKEGEWLLGVDVDPSLMPFVDNQLQVIDIKWLDQKFPDRAVFWLAASLHTAYINTIALNEIVSKFPESERDEFTKLVQKQGALQELDQMGYGFDAIPLSQKAQIIEDLPKNISSIFKTANERGVTMMLEAGMQPIMEDVLIAYQALTPQRARVGYAKLCSNVQNTEDDIHPFKPLERVDLNQPFQAAVKLVSDGSNQGLTGYQVDQYSCNPEGNYGIFNFSVSPTTEGVADPHTEVIATVTERQTKKVSAVIDPHAKVTATVTDQQTEEVAIVTTPPADQEPQKPNFQTMVDNIIAKGWPMLIHANGDHAIEITLDVYENALNGQSGLESRHRIEHCSLLSDKNAKRMQQLGISPSFLIGHVGYWGYAFEQVIFKKKAQLLDRCQTMLDLDARITLHSDLSVSPLGPLRMMEQAVTRIMERSPEGAVLNKAECITRDQALRAITYDAAWQCHTDQWLGSLEEGKLADYVILEQDPLSIKDPKEIRDIPVLQTWVGGKLRYQNKNEL
ncbi:amidohydrolase [Pseudoalteromonas luteoviolacea]|uniref:amidohydrolase n=1 Tax=Pseudoalteromonas luteoviolacea TaxID=43657 RepID=UPI001B388AC2|nr:amidohydrolase [Pseudoalteromonas luteoviolacea]MBQ4834961.1 amidohydrolase [Pseudoalteromonas luteoviolacea]